MTKPTKLNIISKLNNFSNIQVGEAPTTFYDDNMYPLLYNKYGAVSLQKNDETYLSFTNDTTKLSYMQVIDSIKTKNFQLDCTILLTQIRSENILYAFVQGINNLFFKISIKNTFRDGIIITSNNMAISANYKFEIDKKYNISVSKEDDTYTFYINGISHGYKISPAFTNNILAGQNLTFGSNTGTTNTSTSNFRGNLYNLNISYGATLINYKSYTKYGNHLISRQYFSNHNMVDTATLFYCNTETVNESPIIWEIPQITNKEEYAVLNNSLFKTKLNGPYTITFNLNPNNVSQTSNLFTYNNYRIILNIVVHTLPDPDVIVNDNTTAALNFENGIVDEIQTTIWTKEGTADVASTNKIFGENSFETKALGDSLYTNSNIITGGATPYTIEFYALIKKYLSVNNFFNGCAIIAQNKGGADSDQQILIQDNRAYMYRGSNGGANPFSLTRGSTNINFNDINKYTVTYDGVALRFFINDKLDITVGTLTGWDSSHQSPFKFFDNVVSGYTQYRVGTAGIIDNINIHNGIATKVRDTNPYEEFLVVDLAFDGENNSTKIVDNARLNERNEVTYNDNIVSLIKPINNGITDDLGNNWVLNGTTFGPGVFDYQAITNGSISWADPGRNLSSWAVFYETVGSLDFYIKRGNSPSSNVIFNYWYDDIRWKLSLSDTHLILDVYIGGSQTIVFNLPAKIDKFELFSLARHSDNKWELFVDGVSCGKSVAYTGGTYAGIGNNLVISTVNGTHQISLVRFIKGSDTYKSNFVLPTESFKYVPKNNWTVNGNAKISTNQKFDGFSSLYMPNENDYISIYNQVSLQFSQKFTISFDLLIPSEFNSDYNCIFANNESSTSLLQALTVVSNTETSAALRNTVYLFYKNTILIRSSNSINYNSINKITVLYDGISTLSLYLNGVLTTSYIDSSTVTSLDIKYIGYSLYYGSANMKGYIKNFKIYKDVAVIPENPTGKIQLDFDNNVIDKYGNSTWTNNGVTFDQVNSVKGYSSKYENSSFISSNNTNDLNFGANNFYLSFDSKKNTLNSVCYLFSNNIIHNDASNKAIWFYKGSSTNNFSYIDYKDKPINITNHINTDFPNVWYSEIVGRKSSVLYQVKNDVIVLAHNLSNQVFDFRYGGSFLLGKAQWANGAAGSFNGYIDNFKSIKDYQENVIIDKPAVHLPLETNAINIGFTPLTIDSVGNPTYTTIDGKKCIKFEQGKYLTINSNNIFNLGTSSDFYMEFNVNLISLLTYNMLLTNNNSWTTGSQSIWITNQGKIYIQDYNLGVIYESLVSIQLNTWNKIIILRKNGAIKIIINDITETANKNINLNLSINNCYFGCSGWSVTNDRLNGYMSNFKMFVGTSEIPETYNDKNVLDLDFKPTRKSYLFKDNNNKCVIHPVNITQRDYQDSQYCCTFNGTNQYLQLGKNDLLNFGNDDFIINIKFKSNIINGWHMLLCDAASSTNFIDIGSSGFLAVKLGGSRYDTPAGSIVTDTIYDVIIQVINSEAKVYINGEQTTLDGMSSRIVNNVNFNLSNNTYIGCYLSNSEYFNGTIYSIKVLRNTTDLSLLEDKSMVFDGETEVSYTLSNGFDEVSISKDTITEKSIQIVKDTNKVTAIIDDEILEVPATAGNVDTNDLYLFNEYKGNIKDLRVYNKAFYDKDVFEYDGPYDTELGLIDTLDNEYDEYIMVDQGNYIIKGYFEGIAEPHKWRIYNSINHDVLISGTSINYYYDGVDHLYKDDYKILDMVTNKTYDIVDMGPTGSIKVFINSRVCTDSNFVIRAYRRDSGVFIGEYELDKTMDTYECTIHNLDTTKKYDIMLFDKNNNIESRMMSDRSPEAY